MKPLLLLASLVLAGCSSLPPVTQSCLDEPPTDPFMVSMCKTLVSLPERDRADRARWEAAGDVKAPRTEPVCDAACERYRLALIDSGMIGPPQASVPQQHDWLYLDTPHGRYANMQNGWIAGPDGLYYQY